MEEAAQEGAKRQKGVSEERLEVGEILRRLEGLQAGVNAGLVEQRVFDAAKIKYNKMMLEQMMD